LQLARLAFDRSGFRTLFVHERDVVGREDCISAASRIARPLPRGFTGHVAHPSRSIRCESNASGVKVTAMAIHRALFYLSSIPALGASFSVGQNSMNRRLISPFTA
jgi:hypothetical protein